MTTDADARCAKCGRGIGDLHAQCDHCGFDNKKRDRKQIDEQKMGEFLGLIIIGVVIYWWFFTGNDNNAGAAKPADEVTRQLLWMEKGKDAVRSKLKDPDSAKFTNVFFHTGRDGVPVTCGYVNSKNSFGGYTGKQAFVSAGKPELTYLEEGVSGFHKLWESMCQ